MTLFISDFSRVRFGNVTGPSLPRRQLVEIDGFQGVDTGSSIRLTAAYPLIDTSLELSGRDGTADNEIVQTKGWSSPSDDGGGTWRFRLGVSAGANGFTKRNTSNGQYQLIGCATLKGAGLALNGSTDDSAALQAVMDDVCENGGGILSCLRDDSAPTQTVTCVIANKVTIRGVGNAEILAPGGTFSIYNRMKFQWKGADGGVMFQIECGGITFKNITFDVAAGYSCKSFVNFGPSSTKCKFYSCLFDARYSKATGSTDYHVTADINSETAGNCENMHFYDCFFQGFGIAAARHAGNSQPFDWVFQGCAFLNYTYLDQDGKCRGAGLWGKAGYAATIMFCSFDSCESIVKGPATYTIIGGSSERCKRRYSCPDTTGAATLQVSIGGRHAMNGAYLDTSGPEVIAAATKYAILKNDGGTYTDIGTFYSGGEEAAVSGTLAVAGNGGSLVGIGTVYWRAEPATMAGPSGKQGSRVYSLANWDTQAGPTYTAITERFTGGHLPPFYITVTGAATSGSYAFPTPYTEPDTTYDVIAQVCSSTGAPAAGSNRVVSIDKLTTGCTINVEAAPGGVATRKFICILVRQPAS